jgi:hypothetical protein
MIVRCETKAWNLHRAIVCARSEWFQTALAGDFKVSRRHFPPHQTKRFMTSSQEARKKEVYLEEHREQTIDDLVFWIYTKSETTT